MAICLNSCKLILAPALRRFSSSSKSSRCKASTQSAIFRPLPKPHFEVHAFRSKGCVASYSSMQPASCRIFEGCILNITVNAEPYCADNFGIFRSTKIHWDVFDVFDAMFFGPFAAKCFKIHEKIFSPVESFSTCCPDRWQHLCIVLFWYCIGAATFYSLFSLVWSTELCGRAYCR